MPRRLAEKLVVPESHRPAQQLRRRRQERRIPKQIMKPRHYPPRSQGMKQHALRIRRLVGMVFVKQTPPLMRRIHQLFQLPAQHPHLLVAQDPNAFEVAVLPKEFDLFPAQPIPFPVLLR